MVGYLDWTTLNEGGPRTCPWYVLLISYQLVTGRTLVLDPIFILRKIQLLIQEEYSLAEVLVTIGRAFFHLLVGPICMIYT